MRSTTRHVYVALLALSATLAGCASSAPAVTATQIVPLGPNSIPDAFTASGYDQRTVEAYARKRCGADMVVGYDNTHGGTSPGQLGDGGQMHGNWSTPNSQPGAGQNSWYAGTRWYSADYACYMPKYYEGLKKYAHRALPEHVLDDK